jgi:hypothetical protein
MSKKFALILCLFLALSLSACLGQRASIAPEVIVEEKYVVDTGFPAPVEAPGYGADMVLRDMSAEQYAVTDSTANTSSERLVIKDAYLSLSVVNPAKSLDAVIALAEEMGGYVVTSNLYQTYTSTGVQVPQASVTIRIPADKLDEALKEIKAGATTVISENISGQDITSEYTDLKSRLTNLQNAEAQLTKIMENATETEDVLAVFNQLVWVREQIEVIQGQLKYYDQAVAYSAINVELMADEALQPINIGGWKPAGIVKDAIERLVRALQWLAEVLIRLVITVLPILLLIGLPIYFILRAVTKRRRAKKAAQIQKE